MHRDAFPGSAGNCVFIDIKTLPICYFHGNATTTCSGIRSWRLEFNTSTIAVILLLQLESFKGCSRENKKAVHLEC
jgi:hypothetical protein